MRRVALVLALVAACGVKAPPRPPLPPGAAEPADGGAAGGALPDGGPAAPTAPDGGDRSTWGS